MHPINQIALAWSKRQNLTRGNHKKIKAPNKLRWSIFWLWTKYVKISIQMKKYKKLRKGLQKKNQNEEWKNSIKKHQEVVLAMFGQLLLKIRNKKMRIFKVYLKGKVFNVK